MDIFLIPFLVVGQCPVSTSPRAHFHSIETSALQGIIDDIELGIGGMINHFYHALLHLYQYFNEPIAHPNKYVIHNHNSQPIAWG